MRKSARHRRLLGQRSLRQLAALLLLACALESRCPAQEQQPTANTAAVGEMATANPVPQPKAETPAATVPWILRPYHVQIRVSADDGGTVPAPVINAWSDEVTTLLNATFRQMWKVDLAAPESHLTLDEFIQLNSEEAQRRWMTPEVDKVFQVVLKVQPGRFQIACREFDAATRSLGSVYRTEPGDLRTIPGEIAQLVAEAFRPLVEVDVVEGEKLECLIRAGEFPAADDAATQFRDGDYLMPVLRYMDRQKQVRMVQPIAWTYFEVKEIDRSRMGLSLISAFRGAIPKSRRRVELLAIRIRPHLESTEIQVLPRGSRQNPLAGVRCEVMDRSPTREDPVEKRLKLSTDRQGIVTIPANPAHPLQYLQIYSGDALLARVPIIAGIVPFLELEVPDDAARLSVEGEVELLEVELVDIVATREVLMARIRTAAEQNRSEDVENLMRDLQKLPTLDQYLTRIDTLRVQAVYAAQQAKDRVAESRIKRLCAGITEMATKHLDPMRLSDFKHEMNSLRLKK